MRSPEQKRIRNISYELYRARHGNNSRLIDFADEVENRREWYYEIRDEMGYRMTEPQRRQFRTNLASLETTVGKLRHLLTQTGIECNFPIQDGPTIHYPEILDFLNKQIKAERDTLKLNANTGSKRQDIGVLVSQLAVAFDLYDVPRDGIMQILVAMHIDADTKTLNTYLKSVGK